MMDHTPPVMIAAKTRAKAGMSRTRPITIKGQKVRKTFMMKNSYIREDLISVEICQVIKHDRRLGMLASRCVMQLNHLGHPILTCLFSSLLLQLLACLTAKRPLTSSKTQAIVNKMCRETRTASFLLFFPSLEISNK